MTDLGDAPTTGKGRPTPKRNQARAARAAERKAAPQDRKARAAARRKAVQEQREALNQTDVSKLPPTERTPELIYVRDLVDSKFYAGQGAVWFAVAVFVLAMFPPLTVLVDVIGLVGLLMIAVLTWRDSRAISRAVRERYPDSTARVRGYAVRRIFSPRRLRRPVPRVARGAQVR